MEAVDGTIFSAGRVGIPERGQVHRQFRCGAPAWGRRRECGQPSGRTPCLLPLFRTPSLLLLHLLLSLLHVSPSFSSVSPVVCSHMCAGHEVALLACRRAREPLARPLPRGGSIRVATLPAAPSLGRRGGDAMPAPVCVCGGARRCHIDRALVTGERTRTNDRFPLLSSTVSSAYRSSSLSLM